MPGDTAVGTLTQAGGPNGSPARAGAVTGRIDVVTTGARSGRMVGMTHDDEPVSITIAPWTGPWADDDPDANFKSDIAAYAHLDPLHTLTNLSNAIDVPVGAVVHYVLAKWATEGSGGLLELGPRMARRLQQPFTAAEDADDDRQRLNAYHEVRQLVGWLNIPLDDPDVYPG